MRCWRGSAVTLIVGIDPGLTGALALLEDGELVLCQDVPTAEVETRSTKRRHRDYVVASMVDLLATLDPARSMVVIERVGAMPSMVDGRPRNSSVANFRLGVGLGIWQGIAAGLRLPVSWVYPQTWRRGLAVPPGKDGSLVRARELYPAAPLGRKKDHGRADAILIATWAWRAERIRGMHGR